MKALISLFVFAISTSAFAVDPFNVAETFPNVSGLAMTSTSSEGCSGSIVAFEGYTQDQRAYLMTNGHCTGLGDFMGSYPDGDDVFANMAPGITSYLYNARGTFVIEEAPSKLIYATMLSKDLAIYEMHVNYKALSDYGITPLIIASKPNVKNNTKYFVLSSYWQQSVTCEVEESNVPKLHEGPWVWDNVYRFKAAGCKLRGGMSGSPLVDLENRVVGIVNTGYENGEACTVMNPCEVAADGSNKVFADAGYAIDISNMYTCLDSKKRLDIKVPGCTLPQEAK